MGLVYQVNKAIGSSVGRVSVDHHPLGSSSTPLGGIILIYAPQLSAIVFLFLLSFRRPNNCKEVGNFLHLLKNSCENSALCRVLQFSLEGPTLQNPLIHAGKLGLSFPLSVGLPLSKVNFPSPPLAIFFLKFFCSQQVFCQLALCPLSLVLLSTFSTEFKIWRIYILCPSRSL